MTAEPIVRFSGIRKSYDGSALVVRNLDLDVIEGEFLTLLGPSGSGKTTTLMMLAGFETPTEGTILLKGRDITRQPPHQRGIGMVFQNYALFPHMTVGENVGYPLRVRKVAKDEIAARVQRALEKVRLGQLAGRRPAQLSGGQQQRVALARALVFNPDLVLLDEPLGALDKQLREEMQVELKQIHEDLGVTMVYVTHDQSEALTMSDRVAVFNEGRIQQLSTPVALYEQPENAFVAGFVGENNLLSGRIRHGADGAAALVTADDVSLSLPPGTALAGGSLAQLGLRPERLRLVAEADGVPGTVEKVIYMGDGLRLLVRIGAGTTLMVKVPNTTGPAGVTRGDRVGIAWQPGDARLFGAAS